MTLGTESCARSDAGRLRSLNEDYYIINHLKSLYLVADGLGVYEAGEIASKAACTLFLQYFYQGARNIEACMKNTLLKVHSIIVDESRKNPNYRGMGSTFLACHVRKDRAHLCHAGDVRAYLYRKGILKQLTEDHSTLQFLLTRELITPAEARSHPLRHVVNMALGMEGSLEPGYTRVILHAHDILLLCTDGLWNILDDIFITSILGKETGLQVKADLLVENAIGAGGEDNVTALLVGVI